MSIFNEAKGMFAKIRGNDITISYADTFYLRLQNAMDAIEEFNKYAADVKNDIGKAITKDRLDAEYISGQKDTMAFVGSILRGPEADDDKIRRLMKFLEGI